MFGINKESLDEGKLKKESQENLKSFIEKQKQSLSTFTREPGLRYIGLEKLEKFSFKPKEGVLYLPLSVFIEEDLDNSLVLWHIYYELALYPDWKKNAILYLEREKAWKNEIDQMTFYIYKKVNELLEEDNKIEKKYLREYVKKEILDFLFEIDKYTRFLRVLESCPQYRDEEEKGKILNYMKETKDKEELFSDLNHHGFSKSFLFYSLYKDDENYKSKILEKFDSRVLSKSIYEFLNKELIKEINDDKGIVERDPLIKAFIYPSFKKFWLEEIDSMTTRSSDGENDGEKFFEESQDESQGSKLESSREDVEESLKELINQEPKNISSFDEFDESDLKSYGISEDEIDLYNFYVNKTKTQREEMRKFWKKLIGSAKKEINVEKNRQAKGKINVNDLIYSFPDFVEAEQRGSYKNLKIFDKNFLESQNKLLPEKIEISFLIDNSGSMNKEKIEATRKTLAASLLSIQDFNRYLQIEAGKTNQKIEVLTESWFFGKSHYKIKDFDDTNDLEKSEIISSIVKVDASDGTTDDGACLREIYKNISPEQKRRIKSKKEYKIIFEITDGASTFPGATKEIVKKLVKEDVEIYAIQIGRISQIDSKTFNYIWNDSFKYPHGIILGEEVHKLTEELLKVVKKNLKSIFHS
ncbi:MAG: VWA domain-containing protein [Peptoniphilus harei]|uniref:vWA domain-containing protein n=1 Tax=Peptoniphilus harei TaxID=54005 RepID=UPI0028FF94A2|nr:VWA domain-containing protein [Peptoniphilus harei]MDU3086519.1 VWA domain-containing protein [Peptoniphilus harei]